MIHSSFCVNFRLVRPILGIGTNLERIYPIFLTLFLGRGPEIYEFCDGTKTYWKFVDVNVFDLFDLQFFLFLVFVSKTYRTNDLVSKKFNSIVSVLYCIVLQFLFISLCICRYLSKFLNFAEQWQNKFYHFQPFNFMTCGPSMRAPRNPLCGLPRKVDSKVWTSGSSLNEVWGASWGLPSALLLIPTI